MSIPVHPHREQELGYTCECHTHFQNYLAGTFGGFTVTEGEGAWFDGTEVVREQVKVYMVSFNGWAPNFLASIRHELREHFPGEEVFWVAVTQLEGDPLTRF
jgi:hypothetical protein